MVATVTLNIPDEVYQRLELNARATQRSIEDILALVLKVGSPPEWGDVPAEFQADLRDLDSLTDEALHLLASASKIESELDRYDDMLELKPDYQKAADLYQKQGKDLDYKNAIEAMQKIKL